MVRLFVPSDLHLLVDARGDRSAEALAAYVCKAANPKDILILLGDLGHGDAGIRRCLALFTGFPGAKLVVAGNHDIWTDPGGNSLAQHRALGQVFRLYGFQPLEEAPTIVNGLAFAGCMGWYDYSFQDPIGIEEQWYRAKTYPGDSRPTWIDAKQAHWNNMSDSDVVDWQLSCLRRQLESLDSKSEKIVVAMHHVPTKKLLFHPRCLVPRRWRFLNAFLGSVRFEQLLREYASKIAAVFCGHIHLARDVRDHGVRYVSLGGDYRTKQLVIWEGGQVTRKKF